VAAAAVFAPLTVVSALSIGMAPANAADGEILSPADGQTIRSSEPVTISAKTDWYQVSMALYVEGPSGSRQKIGAGGANQTISGSFDPGDAPNGTFTVSLYGEITKKTYATSTFLLSRPPAAPSGVQVDLKGPSALVVRWDRGTEPDLKSYEISSAAAGKSGSVSADEVCDGSTCRAPLMLPPDAAGHKADVSVRAFRDDGEGGSIGSAHSSTASVSVPAPKPSPSPRASKKRAEATGKLQPPKQAPAEHLSTTRPSSLPKAPKLPKVPSPKHPDNTLKLPDVTEHGDEGAPEVAPASADAVNGAAVQSSIAPLGGLSWVVYIALAATLLLIGVLIGSLTRRRGVSVAQDGTHAVPPSSGATLVAVGAMSATATKTTVARARRPAVILAPKAAAAATTAGRPIRLSDDARKPAQVSGDADNKPAQVSGDAYNEPARVADDADKKSGASVDAEPAESATFLPATPAQPPARTRAEAPSDRRAAGYPPLTMPADSGLRAPLRQPPHDVWTEEEDEPIPSNGGDH
jgi:hypothetical protein